MSKSSKWKNELKLKLQNFDNKLLVFQNIQVAKRSSDLHTSYIGIYVYQWNHSFIYSGVRGITAKQEVEMLIMKLFK